MILAPSPFDDEVLGSPLRAGSPFEEERELRDSPSAVLRRWKRVARRRGASPGSELLPVKLLPALTILLALGLVAINLYRVDQVAHQLDHIVQAARMYEGAGAADVDVRAAIDDMLAGGGEVGSEVGNVLGQAVGEIAATPFLLLFVSTFVELLLNACVARYVGRRWLPVLIVAEEALELICELTGEGVGNAAGDLLAPLGLDWTGLAEKIYQAAVATVTVPWPTDPMFDPRVGWILQ